VLVFPNCKINLGLHVVQKRSDGFHDIETVFCPVPLKDVLEVVQAGGGSSETGISFVNYGLHIEGNPEDNLCVKAWHLLKKDFPELHPVQIHLLKNIPMGAGLGGGSADGAFMLKLLNDKFHLSLSTHQLINYALQLGSDCPFFIINQACYATGRGEITEPISLDLSKYQLVLVNPGIHVHTSWAFSQPGIAAVTRAAASLKETIRQPIAAWKDTLVNDFEKAVFEKYPALEAIKENLYSQGAAYAAMSGSGSTVFGLFEKPGPSAPQFPFPYTVLNF
jgi:4-diphosphocytidyl-2-C-methyl-D-erythritol kinase